MFASVTDVVSVQRIVMLSPMRIGTWNLDGRWGHEHRSFLDQQDCDVWLLTEVRVDVQLEGYRRVVTDARMSQGRHWSAILSRGGLEMSDSPHPTTAAAVVGDTTYWSSVLPWRTCGKREPWNGSTHADKMADVLAKLEGARPSGPLVWGGDWNQALTGADYAGSANGRRHLLASIARLELRVPTAGLPHRIADHASIDHIAIPQGAEAAHVQHIRAEFEDKPLSDHDAYLLNINPDRRR